MIKPQKLKTGDKIAIVSLSSGVLGEAFAAHEIELGEKRLKELGLEIEYMPNAREGLEHIREHPEARAADLKRAFADDSIKGIVCAVGGDDTYRTIPHLLSDPEFVEAVKNHPKVFLGFSDTTNNHLMLYKLGLQTYYGQAFLPDFAEFAEEMLPYTKEWAEELLNPSASKEIVSSPVWYEERESFDASQVGTDRMAHDEAHGHEVLRGSGSVEGELLGGCIESLYDQLTGQRYADEKDIIKTYGIFPSTGEWRGKILFAETSEEKPSPEKLKTMLNVLKTAGVFSAIKAIIVGKPMDNVCFEEYKAIWLKATAEWDIPILYNLNIGHAAPRCILPYGGKIEVNFDDARVFLKEPLVAG